MAPAPGPRPGAPGDREPNMNQKVDPNNPEVARRNVRTALLILALAAFFFAAIVAKYWFY